MRFSTGREIFTIQWLSPVNLVKVLKPLVIFAAKLLSDREKNAKLAILEICRILHPMTSP